LDGCWALNEKILSDEDFFQQCIQMDCEREKMFFDSLDNIKQGLCVCVFDGTDRVQHSFWRELDKEHPSHEGDFKQIENPAIEQIYKRADTLLGKTIEKHWALRLWSSAKKAGAKRLLPEKVESLGLSKVSATIFRKKRLSHSDQLVMEITRACYAPDIKEDKRLEIILKCEDRLKLLDDSDVVGTGAAHKCITDIIGLGKGELGADEAAESLLNFWIDRIEQVASEMSSEIIVEKIRGKVDDIIQTGKIIFESIPHPFYLAGQLATATDTLPQSKTFLLRTGEYIKISCDWKRPSKDYPSYLHLEWKANITTPGRIWARFINSDTGKKYKDTCLGNRLEGRRDFESDELGFDPTDEEWAISIIFERD